MIIIFEDSDIINSKELVKITNVKLQKSYIFKINSIL